MRSAETDCSPAAEAAVWGGAHEDHREGLGGGRLSVVGAAEGHLRALAAVDKEEILAELKPGGAAFAGQPPDDRPGASGQEAGAQAADLWEDQAGDPVAAPD